MSKLLHINRLSTVPASARLLVVDKADVAVADLVVVFFKAAKKVSEKLQSKPSENGLSLLNIHWYKHSQMYWLHFQHGQ